MVPGSDFQSTCTPVSGLVSRQKLDGNPVNIRKLIPLLEGSASEPVGRRKWEHPFVVLWKWFFFSVNSLEKTDQSCSAYHENEALSKFSDKKNSVFSSGRKQQLCWSRSQSHLWLQDGCNKLDSREWFSTSVENGAALWSVVTAAVAPLVLLS